MRHTIILGAGLAGICISLGTPAVAADPPATPALATPAGVPVAAACLNDLRAFGTQLRTEGYWLGGPGPGYGYPLSGFAYGEEIVPVRPAREGRAAASGYTTARAGYEIRLLVAAANVQAQIGQQQPCEATLASARGLYTQYAARLHEDGFARADSPGWQLRQIASAVPIARSGTSYRSDQLLDTDVRDATNEGLGSVHDLIIDPATGRIAYIVVARGGIFGIGESFVPVPWESFRVTPNVSLLVLDSTKATMDAAPTVSRSRSGEPGQFAQTSQAVDTYWRAHPVAQPPSR
jgi:sporulation protein YlmC with PRC-barrel domain